MIQRGMVSGVMIHSDCTSVSSCQLSLSSQLTVVSILLSLRDAVPQISLCVLNVANLSIGDDMQ